MHFIFFLSGSFRSARTKLDSCQHLSKVTKVVDLARTSKLAGELNLIVPELGLLVASFTFDLLAASGHLMGGMSQPQMWLKRSMVTHFSQESVERFLSSSCKHVAPAQRTPEVRFFQA